MPTEPMPVTMSRVRPRIARRRARAATAPDALPSHRHFAPLLAELSVGATLLFLPPPAPAHAARERGARACYSLPLPARPQRASTMAMAAPVRELPAPRPALAAQPRAPVPS